jgi:ribosomal protein L39E
MGELGISQIINKISLYGKFKFVKIKSSFKTMKLKQRLGKKQSQNRQIPNWIRFKTGNTIR